jgi:hypothetical protein
MAGAIVAAVDFALAAFWLAAFLGGVDRGALWGPDPLRRGRPVGGAAADQAGIAEVEVQELALV